MAQDNGSLMVIHEMLWANISVKRATHSKVIAILQAKIKDTFVRCQK